MDDPSRFLPLSPHQFHILLALTGEDRHGYAVIQEVERRTDGTLRLGTGTLYTAIARLVELGLIEDSGRPDERRRYYHLLPLGKSVLKAETARLEALVRHAHAQGIRPSTLAEPPAKPRRSSKSVDGAAPAWSRRS